MVNDPTSDAVRQAHSIYQRSLGSRCELAPAAYAAGRVYELIDEPEKALDEYVHALAEPGAQAWPLLLSAVFRCVAACSAEEKTAQQLASRAVTAPPMPELSIYSSRLYRLVGRHADALEILRTCLPDIVDRSSSYWATRELMAAEIALGRPQNAIDTAREAIEDYPEHEGELRSDLAGLLASCGRFDDALAEARLAVSTAPSLAIARFVLGASLLRLDRPDAATSAFDEAIRLDASIESWVTELLSRVA